MQLSESSVAVMHNYLSKLTPNQRDKLLRDIQYLGKEAYLNHLHYLNNYERVQGNADYQNYCLLYAGDLLRDWIGAAVLAQALEEGLSV